MPDFIGDPAFVCLGLASAEDGLIVISLRLRFLSCCWTSVIKLKNSNGNATITLFTPKVDLEK
jgi:hypothetical protein